MDAFWCRQPGTFKNSLIMLKSMNEVGEKVLGLVEGILDLGPFMLIYEVGMGAACLTLIMSLRNGKY